MRNPELYNADEVIKWNVATTEIITKDYRGVPVQCDWVAARPLGRSGPFWYRFKLAWMVFTGKCDVLKWHKQ
jgi:hypothetical protein